MRRFNGPRQVDARFDPVGLDPSVLLIFVLALVDWVTTNVISHSASAGVIPMGMGLAATVTPRKSAIVSPGLLAGHACRFRP